jgi:uncharacterized protein YecE (DUF72 family)
MRPEKMMITSGNHGKIRIGIGGWVFPPWRGTFYPAGLPQARELAHASRHLTAIEINGTFYNSGRPDSFRKWRDETPDGFVFSVKGPRFVTHRNELAGAKDSLDLFFSRGVLELGDKLGPVLWQFAPFKQFDAADFTAFLDLLPRESGGRQLRHLVEVRHPSFRTPAFTDLLRRHGVAVASVDDAKFPAFYDVTADFTYLRLRRCVEDEPTGYPEAELDRWAERAGSDAAEGRDVFLYFINGAKVRAPAAAQALIARL